jgi:non-canonical (house-cleaning) NTP pyrophosphatase
MTVLVGSQNPIKIAAARSAFSDHFADIEVDRTRLYEHGMQAALIPFIDEALYRGPDEH